MPIKKQKKINYLRKGTLHALEGIIAGLIIISFTSGAFHEPIDINNWKIAKLNQESREFINAFDKANLTKIIFQNKPNEAEEIIKIIQDNRMEIAINTIGIPRPILDIGLLIDASLGEDPCNIQEGCFWDTDACKYEEKATQCSILDVAACGTQLGCIWGGPCIGTATACDAITTETTCNSQLGCEWNDRGNKDFCEFSRKSAQCDGLIQTVCNTQLGCSWNGGLTICVDDPMAISCSNIVKEVDENKNQFLKYKNNLSNNIEGETTIVTINGRDTLIYITPTILSDDWSEYEAIIIPVPMEFNDKHYSDAPSIKNNLSLIQSKKTKLYNFLQDGKGLILVSNFVDEDCTKNYDFLKELFALEWNETMYSNYSGKITDSDNIILNTINPYYPAYSFSKYFQSTPIHISTTDAGPENTTDSIPSSEKFFANKGLKLGDADCVNPDCSISSPKYKNQQWIISKSGYIKYKEETLAREEYKIIVVDEKEEEIYDTIYIDINKDNEFESKFGATNCSDLTTQPVCDNQLGCTWNAPNCDENPEGATACSNLTETACGDATDTGQRGCKWNISTELCEDKGLIICNNLITLDTEDKCNTQKGCIWDNIEDECKDLPEVTQCEGLSETICGSRTDNGQRGCTWNTKKNLCENNFQTVGCDTKTEIACGNNIHTGAVGCAWDMINKTCEPAGERFEPEDIISLSHGDYILSAINSNGKFITLKVYESNRSIKIRPMNTISSIYTTHNLETYGPIGEYNYDSGTRNNSQYVLAYIERGTESCGDGTVKCPRYPAIIANYDETNGKTIWMPNNLSTVDEWNLLKATILFVSPNKHEFIKKPHGKTNVVSINKIEIVNNDIYQPFIIQFKMWYHV